METRAVYVIARVGANVVHKRRDLSASQKAIAAAEAWGIAEADGKIAPEGRPRKNSGKVTEFLIKNARDHFGRLFGVNEKFVEMARALMRDDPTAAALVKRGGAQPKLLKDA